ncbi:MAG: anti-sigma regulatory factor [Phycisphaerales bacterium]|nr:anti-sigma regulatory factor [Phycisphaerales bacterium]
MRHLRLQTTSDPALLAPVRRALEGFCAASGFDDKAVGEVGLCLNEAMANITRHAYEGAIDRPVIVEAQFSDNTLVLSLRDWGNGRDPSAAPPRRDPLTPGGLGLICLHKLMDEVTFIPQADGMLLVMKRKLGGSKQ